jgi:excisionase family DNA binding protein
MKTTEKLAVSVPEAARLLGISKPKAYELARRADFPSFQVGGRILVSAAGLQAWVDKRSRKEEARA